MEANKLQQYRTDFTAFAEDLIIPSAAGSARFGDIMADFQRERFAALAPALQAVAAGDKPPVGRYWWEATKGASKDSDLAVALLWLLAFSCRPLLCQVGAADQDQADELRKAAKDILRLNGWLESILTMLETKIVNGRTESTCEIVAADVAGSHGARPDVLLVNELSHITKREFAENMFDNLAKVPRGLGIIATNAGFVPSWQAEWRKIAMDSPRWHSHVWDKPAPWLDAGDVEEAQQRNPASRFNRLFYGIWSSGSGDALSPEWINRALALAGPMQGRAFGWRFCAGLDLSTRRDFSSLVIVGRHVGGCKRKVADGKPVVVGRLARILADIGPFVDDGWGALFNPAEPQGEYEETPATGKLRLAAVELWKPTRGEIDLADIEAAVIRAHERFGLSSLAYDPWQCEYVSQRLRRAGVNCEEVSFSGGNLETMARELLGAFRESRIELFDHPQLASDLRNFSIVETQRGYRLESPRSKSGGHGDCGTAFALALLAAKRLRSGPPTVKRPMAYLPDDYELSLSGSPEVPRQEAAVASRGACELNPPTPHFLEHAATEPG